MAHIHVTLDGIVLKQPTCKSFHALQRQVKTTKYTPTQHYDGGPTLEAKK